MWDTIIDVLGTILLAILVIGLLGIVCGLLTMACEKLRHSLYGEYFKRRKAEARVAQLEKELRELGPAPNCVQEDVEF
jgi:hypothetical protein